MAAVLLSLRVNAVLLSLQVSMQSQHVLHRESVGESQPMLTQSVALAACLPEVVGGHKNNLPFLSSPPPLPPLPPFPLSSSWQAPNATTTARLGARGSDVPSRAANCLDGAVVGLRGRGASQPAGYCGASQPAG